MPFSRPTRDELITRVRADVQAKLRTGPLLARSVLYVLATVLGGLAHLLFGYIDWAVKQMLPDTAEAEQLERWASVFNVQRKPATFARGVVRFLGVDGSLVQAGRKLRRSDGMEYTLDTRLTIAAGIADGSVTAVLPGETGNTPAETQLALVQSVPGVQASAIVQSAGLVEGLDVESDEDLRVRVLQRLREPPAGGSPADYRRWALEVPGVTRVWVRPQAMGPGTVGVTFTTDSAPTGPIPSADKVIEVQAYLEPRRPVTAQVVAFAPAALPVAITIELSPDTTEIRDAVEDALADLFKREAAPGEVVYLSHLREAVSGAAGEVDSTIVSPTEDVTPLTGELPVLGAVSFQ